MKVNDYVKTPRFLRVRISAVLTEEAAKKLGYVEPTHYENDEYEVLGKTMGENLMIFVAVKKKDRKYIDEGKCSYQYRIYRECSCPVDAEAGSKLKMLYVYKSDETGEEFTKCRECGRIEKY